MAGRDPHRVALVELTADRPPVALTAQALADEVLGLAERFAADIAGDEVICWPADNTISTATVILAALCAGVTVFPFPARTSNDLLDDMLQAAGLSSTPEEDGRVAALSAGSHLADPIRIASWTSTRFRRSPTHLLATSGSTSTPKLTPFWNDGAYDPRAVPDLVFRTCQWQGGQRQLLVLPLSHIAPFAALLQGVLDENQLVLGSRLDPEAIASAVEEHRIEWMMLTPNHMQRLLPIAVDRPERFASLRAVLHTALPCPVELKTAWLAALGPERVFEMYGGTEGVGVTVIRGTEWAVRPGSVGRGVMTKIQILDEHGEPTKPGELGQVYMRRLGAPAVDRGRTGWLSSTSDGFVSLGDTGWVDEDGFLFIHDRTANRVAVNEAVAWLGRTSTVLRTHPDVLDAECLRRGPDGGISAFVVPRTGSVLDPQALARHCEARLATHECPTGYIQVTAIPRSELGKVSRTELESMAASIPSADFHSVSGTQ
ncbi:AMP-binding protein [Kitasatospora acidiphila]|uniref:AMP-binding protein n=1 Tax=Kitasatospora acidiphila TaxID=2567942 RepID=UPI003C72CF22